MSTPYPHLPLKNAKPDAKRFIAAILGHAHTQRPPLVEYLVDDALRKPITEQLLGRKWVDPAPGNRGAWAAYWDNFIAFWREMGYDFVRFEQSLELPEFEMESSDPTASSKKRHWRDQHKGAITSWADFEHYPWPKVTPAFFANYEYLASHLPEGMGLMCCHAGGIYEHLAAVFSYEGLCFALYDQPDLVAAVAEKLGTLMLDVYRQLVELPGVIAIFPGDDMGFRSGTLIPPDALRKYTLPWHKRFAALAHGKGLPYFLHSCGNLAKIMPDLIEDVGIDAKHSYENAIMPAPDFQAIYGDKIGVLGGVDVDILTRGTQDEVRAEVRHLIAACQPKGRYCLGSGNSVPSYVPLANYLAMIDEAQR